ncbi:MAG: glycosyltransferase, partial [Phycisphaerae bacterium]|nr:glycosyltransferase [Phycisphaerae bacterium]
RDSTGAVVLEAMAKSLPVLTLNHQGMRLMVPDDAGIKVAVTSPQQVAADLAAAMDRLAVSPELRAQLSAGALHCAEQNTWPQRARQIAEYYESARM